MIELQKTEQRVHIRLRAIFMGKDLCVLLDGGDTPHIGAVALAMSTAHAPQPAHAAQGEACITQVLCIPKHREDALSAEVAQTLCTHLGCTVTCLCGIHIDAITPTEIITVLALAKELTEELLSQC